jgi:hypothetical protein
MRTPLQETGARLLQVLAQAMIRSWHSGFSEAPLNLATVATLLQALEYPEPIRTKRAEGYALYALYPENYVIAALASQLGPRTHVIGIRSIGTGLAALVAAALNADLPITVRPVGDPFERRLRVASELTAEIVADADFSFAIVDEGPGLSGSSFGAVADWLEANGIARDRIHFFPSHLGDLGPEASTKHRARWAETPQYSVDIEDSLVQTKDVAHRLENWVSKIVGPLDGPMDDISGGSWRQLRHPDERQWPASDTQRGRRKFLAKAGGTEWLVKFAAVGDEGLRKERKARLLHESGLTAEIAGSCHGFIIERWVLGAPLDVVGVDRPRLVDALGRYLGYRARNLRAGNGGASIGTLMDMASYNASQALGAEAADAVYEFCRRFGDLDGKVQRVDTDNRLHEWEWLVTPSGDLIKTDALDHSAGHDLIGCQDIAWDVAGAIVEHRLSADEAAHVRETIESIAARVVEPDLITALTPCYLAFQLGLWTYAALSAGGADTARSQAMMQIYTDELSKLLAPVTLRS